MTRTCFITGATGFIGYRLARDLKEAGANVRCLARSSSAREKLEALGVEIVEGSLEDRRSLERGTEGADCVFHLAGLTRENRKGEFIRVNCDGSRNVALACLAAAGSKEARPVLVAVSSLACVGPAPKAGKNDDITWGGRRLLRETDLPRPVSAYGRSKLEAEKALVELSGALNITVVRPPYVFGEGDHESRPLYSMAAKYGNFVVPGWVDRFYSFVEVRDLVKILDAAAKKGERLTPDSLSPLPNSPRECPGTGIYFGASPEPVRFSEFGRALCRAYGKKPRIFRIPPMGVVWTGIYGEVAKALGGRPSFDWNKATEALRGPWICSGAKAASGLGCAPVADLISAFEEAARWYEREGLL